jgi:hypothetical protein
MDKEDRRFRIVPYANITDLSPQGFVITDVGLDMPVFEPVDQILVIHSELNEPVPNQKRNNKKDHHA